MPTIQVLPATTAPTEPVTLALLSASLRLDLDAAAVAAYEANPSASGLDAAVAAQLELLAMLRTAARELVEQHTSRYFAAQKLRITYELGEEYLLPDGATATAVSGFFTTLADLLAWQPEEYRKGISVSRELPWGEALRQTYTVEASITAPVVPGLAKTAILELVGEWYRNRETTAAGATLSELPVSWRVKLAPLRINPLAYS